MRIRRSLQVAFLSLLLLASGIPGIGVMTMPFMHMHMPSMSMVVHAADDAATARATGAERGRADVEYVVEVSEFGFNGVSDGYVLEAEEGQRVSITFVYADDHLDYDNPHILTVRGYEVTSEQIDGWLTEDTIEFVATETGEFVIECTLPCHGHSNLRSALLLVEEPSEADRILATNLQLNITSGVVTNGSAQRLEVTAVLQDETGAPVAGMPIDLYQAVDFFGNGAARLGRARTGDDGTARFSFTPRGPQEVVVLARYSGSSGYDPTEAEGNAVLANRPPGYNPPPSGFDALQVPGLGSWMVWAILGMVWFTYAIVGAQIVGIRRAAPPPDAIGTGRPAKAASSAK